MAAGKGSWLYCLCLLVYETMISKNRAAGLAWHKAMLPNLRQCG